MCCLMCTQIRLAFEPLLTDSALEWSFFRVEGHVIPKIRPPRKHFTTHSTVIAFVCNVPIHVIFQVLYICFTDWTGLLCFILVSVPMDPHSVVILEPFVANRAFERPVAIVYPTYVYG